MASVWRFTEAKDIARLSVQIAWRSYNQGRSAIQNKCKNRKALLEAILNVDQFEPPVSIRFIDR